jgi:hypothetical protein
VGNQPPRDWQRNAIERPFGAKVLLGKIEASFDHVEVLRRRLLRFEVTDGIVQLHEVFVAAMLNTDSISGGVPTSNCGTHAGTQVLGLNKAS